MQSAGKFITDTRRDDAVKIVYGKIKEEGYSAVPNNILKEVCSTLDSFDYLMLRGEMI
jgi:hypothetical protein